MSSIEKALQAYIDYYESLTPETVNGLRELADPAIHFKDPFNDIVGIDKVIQIMDDMFVQLENPKFKILDVVSQGNKAYIKWDMTFNSKVFKPAGKQYIIGMSEVLFNEEGKLVEHLDYWDAATYFYEKLPLVGFLIHLIKRKLAV